MKIIDLLNLIAKGEEVPKKIKFKGEEYMFYGINYTTPSEHKALHRRIELNNLNDEVIVIEEEKEIEKIKELPIKLFHNKQKILTNKLNELIDIINDMRDKE